MVALVISIIVLLILATVSINLIINNGILDKAKSAVDKYSEGEEFEQIQLAVLSAQMNNKLTTESLNAELQRIFNNDKEATEYSDYFLYKTNKNYRIYKDGKVEEGLLYNYDGLILHLDAIDNTLNGHNNNSNTWYDLSGNNRNAELINCTVNDNNIEFNGTSSYGILPNGSLGNWGSPTTIEILAKVENKAIIIADNPNNSCRGIATHNDNNKIYQYIGIPFGNNSGRENLLETSTILHNNIVLYSLIYDGQNYNNTIIYSNAIIGNQISEKNGYSNDDATSVTIGRRFYSNAGGWFLKGKIYSIRVYNRELSKGEIENNYNVDINRFNL